MSDELDDDFADIIDVAEALERVIQASDPDKRAALAQTIDLRRKLPGLSLGHKRAGAVHALPIADVHRYGLPPGIGIEAKARASHGTEETLGAPRVL